MQLICKGQTDDVEELLKNAPAFVDQPQFTDARVYRFSMFSKEIDLKREDRSCSPLAIAVNVGDIRLVELLLTYLSHVQVENGLTIQAKSGAIMKANIFSSSKHKTPLQFACSLGLYLIVARILKEGANPDLLP